MSKLTLHVTIDVQGDVDEMEELVRQYLTASESPFHDDYGPPSKWEIENCDGQRQDGYEGPFAVNVSVTRVKETT